MVNRGRIERSSEFEDISISTVMNFKNITVINKEKITCYQ